MIPYMLCLKNNYYQIKLSYDFFYVSWCPSKCSAISALLNLEYMLDPQRLKPQAPNTKFILKINGQSLHTLGAIVTL